MSDLGAQRARGSSEPLPLMVPVATSHGSERRPQGLLVTHFWGAVWGAAWVSGTETGVSQPAYLGGEEPV